MAGEPGGGVLVRGGIRARAAIFDFNGTITLDEHVFCAIFRELLAPVGAAVTEDEYYDVLAGLDDATLVRRALELRGLSLDEEAIAALVRRRVERYLEWASASPPVRDGSRALVLELAPLIPLAVVTAAFREEVELVLTRAGLRGLFTAVVTLEDVTRAKPDPEGYLAALDRLNGRGDTRPLRPADVVVFEDSVPGVAAAKAAGMACVAVLGTLDASRAHELAAADLVVPELGPKLVLAR